MQGEDEVAGAGGVAVLAEVDPLPGSEEEPASADGDGERRADQRRFDVGGHVVRAFEGVDIGPGLWGDFVDRHFEVAADVGIGVLIDREGGGGVLNEDMEEAGLDLGELW